LIVKRRVDFNEFFGEQLDQFWASEIEASRLTRPRARKLAIMMWIWIVKGLVVRSDPRGYTMLDRIGGLLKEDGELKGWIAKRLAVVVDQKDETISPKNFAVIKVEHWPSSSTAVCLRSDTNSIWNTAQFLSMQRACHYLIGRLVRDYAETKGMSQSVSFIPRPMKMFRKFQLKAKELIFFIADLECL
jgi:hypothetical protein